MNIMKKFIILTLMLSLIVLTSNALSSEISGEDPGIADTIKVGYVHASPSGKTVVPVTFYNDQDLAGLEVVVTWSNPLIVADSFSFVNGRTSDFTFKGATIGSNSMMVYSFPILLNVIASGSGLLGNIYFSHPTDLVGDTLLLDSLTIIQGNIVHSNFFSDTFANQFKPQFIQGAVVFADVSCCIGMRGNFNNSDDNEIGITDLTDMIAYFFEGGDPPVCRFEANVDGDPYEEVNILDLTYLIDYIFLQGPAPASCP